MRSNYSLMLNQFQSFAMERKRTRDSDKSSEGEHPRKLRAREYDTSSAVAARVAEEAQGTCLYMGLLWPTRANRYRSPPTHASQSSRRPRGMDTHFVPAASSSELIFIWTKTDTPQEIQRYIARCGPRHPGRYSTYRNRRSRPCIYAQVTIYANCPQPDCTAC